MNSKTIFHLSVMMMALTSCAGTWQSSQLNTDNYVKIENPARPCLPMQKAASLPCLSIMQGLSKDFIANETESVEIIKLETSRKSIIGGRPRLVIADSDFLVTDSKSNQALLFDGKGNFVRQIGKYGGGSKEYSSLESAAYSNGVFSIMDSYTRSIVQYSRDGEFLRKATLDIAGLNGASIQSSNGKLLISLVCGRFVHPYKIQILGSDCSDEGGVFPVEYTYPQISDNLSKASSGNILINPVCSDTIFEIGATSIAPRYTLGYYHGDEGRQIQEHYCSLGPNEFIQEVNSEDDKALMRLIIHDLKDNMVLEYSTSPNIRYITVADKSNFSSATYLIYNKNKNFCDLPAQELFSCNGDCLYTFCGKEIKDFTRIYSMLPEESKAMVNSSSDEDNPMILKIKLKSK